MPIEFNCPFCGRSYRVAEANAGKRVKCKDCSSPITVPDPSGLGWADEDTAEQRKLRNAPTEILPNDRPRKSLSALPKGAIRKVNVPSDTAKVSDKPASRSRPATRARTEAEPEPEVKLPAGKLPAGKLPGGLKSPGDLPAPATRIARRPIPEAPKKRSWNFVFLLGALALIVGFFLPWATPGVGGFEGDVSGWNLALRMEDLLAALQQAGLYSDNAVLDALRGQDYSWFVFFVVYLVPVIALYTIVDELRCAGKGKSHWWYRILAFLSPALAGGAIYLFQRGAFDAWFNAGTPELHSIDTGYLFATIGPGAYTMAGGWLFVGLSIFLAPKVKKPKTPPLPPPRGDGDDDDDVPDISSSVRPAGTRPKLPKPRKPQD